MSADDFIEEDSPVSSVVEDHTVAARNKMREQLSAEVAAFLAGGGRIQMIDNNVTADPPKLSNTEYGRQPI